MAGQPGIRHVYTAGAFKPEEVAGERDIEHVIPRRVLTVDTVNRVMANAGLENSTSPHQG